MNVFLKSILYRMNRNKKIIKIFLKELNKNQRKYTTPTSDLNLLNILKKQEML